MKIDIYKAAAGGIMSVITYLLGGWEGLLQALVAVIIIDYATGLMCGWAKKTLSSQVGAVGIIKKVMYLAVVAVAHILDGVLGETGMIRDAVIYVFIANECLSIVENAAVLGLPIPDALIDKLEQLKGKDDEK